MTSQVLLTAPPIQARYTLLLTRDESDVVAAQRLRHRVFAGERRAGHNLFGAGLKLSQLPAGRWSPPRPGIRGLGIGAPTVQGLDESGEQRPPCR